MTALSPEDSASLGDALQRLLQDRYGFTDARRRDLATPADVLPSVWSSLVEIGLTGLTVPEAHGGFGGGVTDLQRVQEELGRALVVSPWLDVVLGAWVILRAARPAQQEVWLSALSQGSMTLALARYEISGLEAPSVVTRARASNDGWRIDGGKANVLHACAVSHLLVDAQLPDGRTAWFLIDASHEGIERRPHRLVDHAWCAEVSFTDVAAERLDGPLAEHTGDLHACEVAAYCAEMAGGAQAALALTVSYLRTRQQFGQPLGDYQALRHRIADMAIAMEQLRSAAALALDAVQADDPVARIRLASQALLVGCESATWILRQAIQLHGGMGMTEELAVGHYYRRQLVINAITGGEASALASLAREV